MYIIDQLWSLDLKDCITQVEHMGLDEIISDLCYTNRFRVSWRIWFLGDRQAHVVAKRTAFASASIIEARPGGLFHTLHRHHTLVYGLLGEWQN
jgi:hypothetical protein